MVMRGSVLMDLSKAFDTLNHELLIAKLHAYGFDKKSLSLINSYLTDRWQRVKIGTAFSSWKKLLVGVPQGSILGPLLIYLKGRNFGGKKIWRIWRFLPKTAKLSSRQI